MRNASLSSLIRHRVHLTIILLASCLLAAGTLAAPASEPSSDRKLELLQREIARLAALARGTVGVGAIHLESGRAVYLNRSERFAMASTYKVPMAVQLLHRVDQGQASLDEMVTLQQSDLSPGSGMITRLLDDPGVVLSLRNLLELMLIISDNTATDLVLQAAGGGQEVTARMRALGIAAMRVDRPTLGIIADWAGIQKLPPREELSPEAFRPLYEAVSAEERARARAAFETDLQDTATPEAMARLLEKLWRGELLSPESTELLLDIMRRCRTGANRIEGLLPPDTEVAHKTGTIGRTTNDVGIIRLPEEAGHVVVVVFVKESELDVEKRERAIAQISRAIYDFFLFNPQGM
ncbi:MAG: class A beta-lactamase [Terriglobia bacterium]